MNDTIQKLDELIATLEGAVKNRTTDDALDRILNEPARTTATRSLRDDATIRQFRTELSDGLIRVDSLNQLLGLVTQVVGALAGGPA